MKLWGQYISTSNSPNAKETLGPRPLRDENIVTSPEPVRWKPMLDKVSLG